MFIQLYTVVANPGLKYEVSNSADCKLKLQTNVRKDFTIMEKDPTRVLYWLKVPCAFTFKTLTPL